MDDKNLREFRRALRLMERFLTGSVKEDGECCGVTFNECHILMEMAGSDGIVMTDLSRKLGLDKSIISRTVDSMVKSGLIRREEDPRDRRKKCIVLTEKGNGKALSINETMNRKYREFFSRLDETETGRVLESMTYLAAVFDRLVSSGSGCCTGGGNDCICSDS